MAAATWCLHHGAADPVVLACWLAGTGTLSSCAYAVVENRRLRQRPMATGRIVAIVSAHEPDPDTLRAGICSILDQRGAVVDEVHVVDDGSTRRPVQPFAHPRVRWHRTGCRGKRAAEVYVLDRLDPDDWDFVLTVDGDCILDDRAIGHQLRAFSRPQVTATIGTVIARNAGQNLLTRLADVHLGTSGVRRSSRSRLGTRQMVAGAPVLYRARTAFERRARPASDDRRLALSPAGEVVRVQDATAWTRAPAGAADAYRQSLRRLAPGALAGRYALVRLVLGYALVADVVSAWRGTLQWQSVAVCLAMLLVVRYVLTGRYLTERPQMSSRAKLWTWLLLTPAEAVATWLFVIPIRDLALLRIGRRRWATRRDDLGPGRVTIPAAGLGAIYYTGQLPDGTAS